jgi:membrane protein
MIKQTASEWMDQDVSNQGAALAFYTLFAITPLFLIVLRIAGSWFGEEAARRELFTQVSGLVGSEGGEAIQALVSSAHKPDTGAWAMCVAVATLLAGTTGVFVQLQAALNSVWGVHGAPGRGMWNFIKVRLFSFALVAGIGFLLLVSLILSAGLSALGAVMLGLPAMQQTLWQRADFAVSFAIITLLFAVLFKMLPDAKIAWRDVWMGAIITALLFNVGKLLFGLYVGRGSFTSAYGAAGSLVVVLLWVYYSAQILFFGAQFTRVYSNRDKTILQPPEKMPCQTSANQR